MYLNEESINLSDYDLTNVLDTTCETSITLNRMGIKTCVKCVSPTPLEAQLWRCH